MNDVLITKILNAYGVHATRIQPPQKGYRNESYPVVLKGGQTINVLLYKIETGIATRIQNANRVANFLAANDYPARKQYDPRILQIRAGKRYKYCCLYEYLPGTTIPWEGYTQEHIKQLGQYMSDMHAVLSTLDYSGLPSVAGEYAAIAERMQGYFAQPGVQRAMQQKLGVTIDHTIFERLQRMLAWARTLPGTHALHMDFVRGNILFNDVAQITGVLDFEKTAAGNAAFDIARTLAFLLVDCKYKQPDKIRKYFLQSGYHKRGSAPLPPQELIDSLVPMFLLHDFYKFLRHSPYESLAQNEHYTRTRDMLLTSNLLINRHSREGGNPVKE
ncbi:MAG TPA: phosphotransferase [Candidatus Saccharimonadales bacterium]|nr:phosphotransferase [Candidatus Saccharimonadales bacterium]